MNNDVPEIGSPARTKAILNRYRLVAKKSLGQNFLSDLNILRNIVSAADVTDNDNVIEIGPGIGALTEQLARRARRVVAFEIDENLLPVLDETLMPYDNVKIINQDILKANLPEVIQNEFEPGHPIKLVANLPYYITTPILMGVLKSNVTFDQIVVMMQAEVADRLVAEPGTKAYGSLSVVMQYRAHVEVAFNVPRTAFIPQPNVDSAIIRLTPRAALPVEPYSDQALYGFVKGCFAHRRKSLWNNLQGIFGKQPEVRERIEAVLDKVEISRQLRPERLTLINFIELVNAFHADGLM
ncbi:ribosomal RNA small subunit methyltransferase A [Levilactobacillus zymae]|uniref:Ribosomal RNA small subunit methyltransferase A n=1 Tax=Levilactobacillus zymae TaxID=267363 RepID=A0ABQ0X1M4_9LACO|nr:16S rRNA (adenine(1518)-N(6)/adenine(1519)-N(6))-dimethyltransferase RsmA [Levilactobacillus zymae]KRL15159.1 dimethyladenosine transferase [Levilactobacillus zymae DSM 19395]QFR61448.1 16S rRNA (adenine(1518)-N(6)/adenine(1519)-N(6))-dimethyltransferase RsmA [Levilactobacillus zymae]GEO71673.1 ribosomal RNA small subunit methyltransferase A [Levilactobacillus zymae]